MSWKINQKLNNFKIKPINRREKYISHIIAHVFNMYAGRYVPIEIQKERKGAC